MFGWKDPDASAVRLRRQRSEMCRKLDLCAKIGADVFDHLEIGHSSEVHTRMMADLQDDDKSRSVRGCIHSQVTAVPQGLPLCLCLLKYFSIAKAGLWRMRRFLLQSQALE